MGSYKIARVGDTCTHGATIITGEDIRTVEGKKVARVGDLVNCPIHGVNPIISSYSDPMTTTSKKTAHVRSVAKCGAVIITGSDITYLDR